MPSDAKAAASSIRKLIRAGKSFCGIGFNSSKCKTEAKLAMARMKLLRNKREVVVRQMRRDVAMLLEGRQDSTARIRIEHVIREQNIMAANEIIELFCELIVARLPIIAKQKDCPPDLKEGISSLIFAAPRCSDIPELSRLRDVFEKKYGKDFVSAATDLRPESGVNRTLIEKLSVRTPSGEVKLKIMKEIAKEYQVEWDTTESEMELLKPPEEPLKGPNSFTSASRMPVRPCLQSDPTQKTSPNATDIRLLREDKPSPQFKNAEEAAQAAKELAEQATAAAEAAARLARRSSQQRGYVTHLDNILSEEEEREKSKRERRYSYDDEEEVLGKAKIERRHSYNDEEEVREKAKVEKRHSYNEEDEVREKAKIERRHSYNTRFDDSAGEDREKDKRERRHGYGYSREDDEREKEKKARRHSCNIRFDDSDGVESGEEEEEEEKDDRQGRRYSEGGSRTAPPNRPAPTAADSRVHPRLPQDYDELTARFDALRRSRR